MPHFSVFFSTHVFSPEKKSGSDIRVRRKGQDSNVGVALSFFSWFAEVALFWFGWFGLVCFGRVARKEKSAGYQTVPKSGFGVTSRRSLEMNVITKK